jgi:hypothetical protein
MRISRTVSCRWKQAPEQKIAVPRSSGSVDGNRVSSLVMSPGAAAVSSKSWVSRFALTARGT